MNSFKIDKIISMSYRDKETGELIKWTDEIEPMDTVGYTDTVKVYGNPKLGDHIFFSGTVKKNGKSCIFEVDGFYGGSIE